jgi:hypothetical protein
VKAADGTRLAYGSLLLLAPTATASKLGLPVGARERGLVRLAGARHVIQAVVTTVVPTPTVRRAGAAADLLHALTDALAARLSPTWRAGVATDGSVTLALAALNLHLSNAGPAASVTAIPSALRAINP